MIVYRVESTEYVDPRTGLGAGPFAGMWYTASNDPRWWDVRDMLLEAMKEARARGVELPTPAGDPLLGGISPSEVCGVDNMNSIRTWFGSHLQAILDDGFQVRKYEVPDWACRRGLAGQVVFRHDQAVPVDNEEKY